MSNNENSCCCNELDEKVTITLEKTETGVKVEISPCCTSGDKSQSNENSCNTTQGKEAKCC